MEKEQKKPSDKPAVVIDAKFLQTVFTSAGVTDCLIRLKSEDAEKIRTHQPIVIIVEK